MWPGSARAACLETLFKRSCLRTAAATAAGLLVLVAVMVQARVVEALLAGVVAPAGEGAAAAREAIEVAAAAAAAAAAVEATVAVPEAALDLARPASASTRQASWSPVQRGALSRGGGDETSVVPLSNLHFTIKRVLLYCTVQ